MKNFHYIIIQNESEICKDGNYLFHYNETKKYVEKAQLKNVKNVLAL